MKPRKPTIFLVAHGDHNFQSVNCVKEENRWKGHMDNQLGVYTVYQAYFSGQLPQHTVNIQITYGEQKTTVNSKGEHVSFLGAREVMEEVTQDDLVIVIDVTSMPEQYQGLDFTIQKCKNQELKKFFKDVFDQKYKYQIFEDTPDTEANQDQTDAFREITSNVIFFGMMVYGGDYNCVPVYCNFESQKKSVQALIDLCKFFQTEWPKYLDKLPKSPQKIANQHYLKIFQPLKTFTIIPSSSKNNHQDLQDSWRSSSRKFIFSQTKSHIDIPNPPSTLSQLIQSSLSLPSYKSQISSFQSPKQSTLIFSTKSQSLIKQQIQLNDHIQQINKFTDKTGNQYLFIIIKQKDIKRVGIYIHP